LRIAAGTGVEDDTHQHHRQVALLRDQQRGAVGQLVLDDHRPSAAAANRPEEQRARQDRSHAPHQLIGPCGT
jgi:hypothetical protein